MAEFIAAYGWGTYAGVGGRWPTGDGVIPMRLLVEWLGDVPRRQAAAQLRDTLAVQLGAASAMTGDKPPIRAAFRRLERLAGG